MQKIVVLYFFVLLVCHPSMANQGVNQIELDSLLKVLDKTISERELYTDIKNTFIEELKIKVEQASSPQEKFSLYNQIFQQYKSFQMDSALVVANKRINIAKSMKNPREASMSKILSELNLAEVMIVTGMYKEALDILDKQDRSIYTSTDEWSALYHLYHSLYMLMSQYSFSNKERKCYLQLEYQYKDSILTCIDPGNVGYELVRCSKFHMDGNYNKALQIALDTYKGNIHDTRITAMVAHSLSDIYGSKGDSLNQLKYLTISSIADIRSGVKEYMSLPELASLLYVKGDINRAYAYMKCSMEDALFCKARLRTLEMSRMLPIINAAYDMKMEQERNQLISFLIVIVLLVIVLAISLIYIYKKLKELAFARRSLKDINTSLKNINDDLKNLNLELSESNHVKEEYIGYVFSMCSSYINKLDEFRKVANRKIKAGQIDELFKQTNSSSFVSDQLKEFYKSFDAIFLNIYPNFIEDFNSLLMDGEFVRPKEGELLSPELRIYALVRLGINDSVKIASFLHYSPQTVYNYRLKLRNKAKVDKNNFSDFVRQLGIIKK